MARTGVALRGVLLVLAAIALLPAVAAGTAPDDEASGPDDGPVYVIEITGTIDLGLAPYTERVLDEAADADAAAVIVRIDTPGGRLDAVFQMRDALLDSEVRTLALVDPNAFSAGALVAIASDEIHMTPGAVMGAATPVSGATGEVADAKTISAVRATFESTAEENGRDPQVAAAMVDPQVVVEGLDDEDELLTLTVSEAVEFGYADSVVDDLDDLLAEQGLDDDELVRTSPGLAERLVRLITNPAIAGLLLLGGFLTIVGDLFSGGVGVLAVVGVGLLALFFWGHLLAGLAGWEDVALVVLGLLLIAAEVFVIPGFGVAGVLGLVSLGAGAFLAMLARDFDIVTTDDLWRAGLTVILSLLATAVGVVLIVMLVARRGAPGGLVLSARLGSGETVTERSSSGWLGWFDGDARLESDRVERPAEATAQRPGALVGTRGVAATDLRPAGVAEIDGVRVDVVTSGELIRRGSPVEVVLDEGYRRVVREAPDAVSDRDPSP